MEKHFLLVIFLFLTASLYAADGVYFGFSAEANGWTVAPGRLPGIGRTHDMPLHLRE